MDDRRQQDEMIEALLRQVHESTAPADSWEALRGRIDGRCRTAGSTGDVVFWRRLAMAAAACFVLTAALLCYVMFRHPGAGRALPVAVKADPPLLDDAQIERLTLAFSHVRSVFAGQSPWFMIDSAGNSQLGLAEVGQSIQPPQRLIVLRLALRDRQSEAERPYADVVAFPHQRIDVQLRTAEGSLIGVSLVPVLGDNGRVSIDVVARGDEDSRAAAVRVDESAFRPLLHVRVGVHTIVLDATARSTPMSERT